MVYLPTLIHKYKPNLGDTPENFNMSPENQWLVQMYSLLKCRPFLGDMLVGFLGCKYSIHPPSLTHGTELPKVRRLLPLRCLSRRRCRKNWKPNGARFPETNNGNCIKPCK